MKIRKIYFIAAFLIIFAIGFKFLVLQKPDSRLLHTVRKETFLETVQVSGTFHKTATDTEKASAHATYQGAISSLITAKQSKQTADATMWAKRQAVLEAENGVNYKNDNTTNPTTKNEYTILEKLSIDSAVVEAEKDFRSAETKYKEADIAISAAQAQVNLAKIAYEDTLEDEPYLTVYINEIYAPKISAGQKVDITFDAIRDLSLSGEIKYIDTIGTIVGGVVTFEAKIQVHDLPTSIKPNMTAIATIELIRKKDTFAVPMSALIYQEGKVYVQKAEDRDDQLTEVRIGEKGFVKVEILSGLNSGTNVLARPNSKSP